MRHLHGTVLFGEPQGGKPPSLSGLLQARNFHRPLLIHSLLIFIILIIHIYHAGRPASHPFLPQLLRLSIFLSPVSIHIPNEGYGLTTGEPSTSAARTLKTGFGERRCRCGGFRVPEDWNAGSSSGRRLRGRTSPCVIPWGWTWWSVRLRPLGTV